MELKILGTVAPYCKDGKYCPGYLIKEDNKKILLDCGNGITNLLNMEEDLEDLTIIISHMHKDHYGDLLSLAPTVDLYHRFGFINKKVKLYVPEINYEKTPEHYTDKDGWGVVRTVEKSVIIDDELIRRLGEEHYFDINEYKEESKIKIGDITIDFCKTLHPINTYAIKIEDKTGTIVYSSDTGYEGKKLVNFAKDSDIFLCEASFLRGQIRNDNYHLYAYEAAKLAKKANVGQLVLTQFWPEIDKQEYVDEASKIFENTIAAEEGKVLTLTRR